MKIFMKKLAWKKGNLFCRTKEWKAKLKYIQSKVDVDPYNKELRIEESNTFKEYCDAYDRKNGAKRVSFKIDLQNAYAIDAKSAKVVKDALDHLCNMSGLKLICEMKNVKAKVSWKVYDQKNGAKRVSFKIDLQNAYAIDAKSVKVVKDALDHFCNMSGLKPNMGKSTVFSGNITDHVKQAFLSMLPLKIGTLPISYLGVPLISKQVGRLQLIASVLSVIHVYWEYVFIIPKTVIKYIDKILKGFLWNQSEMKNVKAKVSWKVVCGLKDQSGIGLKNLSLWNEVLMSKHLWNMALQYRVS
ncbi:hypothetical protein Tco_0211204 [Tanacetum coccineum]